LDLFATRNVEKILSNGTSRAIKRISTLG